MSNLDSKIDRPSVPALDAEMGKPDYRWLYPSRRRGKWETVQIVPRDDLPKFEPKIVTHVVPIEQAERGMLGEPVAEKGKVRRLFSNWLRNFIVWLFDFDTCHECRDSWCCKPFSDRACCQGKK